MSILDKFIEYTDYIKAKDCLAFDLQHKAHKVFEYLTEYFYLRHQKGRIMEVKTEIWTQQLRDALYEVPILPKTHKFPDANFIVKNTYDAWSDSILLERKRILYYFYQSGYVSLENISDEDFLRFCLEYFTRIAEILSKEGFLYQSEVKNILEIIS